MKPDAFIFNRQRWQARLLPGAEPPFDIEAMPVTVTVNGRDPSTTLYVDMPAPLRACDDLTLPASWQMLSLPGTNDLYDYCAGPGQIWRVRIDPDPADPYGFKLWFHAPGEERPRFALHLLAC